MWDWREDAACWDEDPELFTTDGETGPLVDEAKKICAGCPVAASCLEWATTRREPAGVWAGMTVNERRDLIRGQHIPRTRTFDVSTFVDAIALADRIDDLSANHHKFQQRVQAEFKIGRDEFGPWRTRFAARLNGGADEPFQDIMRVR